MSKDINIMGIAIFFILALFSLGFCEESFTITTYYPSPYGSYNQLYVADKLGIGTTGPTAKLEVNLVNPSGWSGNQKALRLLSPDNNYYLDVNTYVVGGGNVGYQFSPNANVGLVITTPGNVGIGTGSPGYTLTVNGTTWCISGAWAGSDLRWKRNVKTLENPLHKLLRLRGVEYDWKREEFKGNNFPEGRQIGIIAQDMEKEFPELVTTDKDGYKAIAYDRFTAVLLEAIKAQQKEIEGLKQEIIRLKEK